MPLSKTQTEILRLLAVHRDPESYVAGASPLNRDAPRISDDIDLFHDREERVAAAALNDTQVLAAAGYAVSWLRQLPLIYTAEVSQGDASTRVEWVVDSDYRFFPTMRDETFGYVLHPVDQQRHQRLLVHRDRRGKDAIELFSRSLVARNRNGACPSAERYYNSHTAAWGMGTDIDVSPEMKLL